jgi:hypothetical protein
MVYQALNIDDFNDGAADVRYSDTDRSPVGLACD